MQNEFMIENKLNYKFSKSIVNIMNHDSNIKTLDEINNNFNEDMEDSINVQSTLKIDKDKEKMSESPRSSHSDFDDTASLDVNQSLNCILCNKELN